MRGKSYYRVIGGIESSLDFSITSSAPEANDLTLNKYDRLRGLLFNNQTTIFFNPGFTFDENQSYTLFISMTLNDSIKFNVTESTATNLNYNPIFTINKDSRRLIIESSGDVIRSTTYPSKFNNRQVMIYFYFHRSSLRYGINLSNEAFVHYDAPSVVSTFRTNLIKIRPNNVFINKICYLNSFLTDDNQQLKIIFEEKRNGTLVS